MYKVNISLVYKSSKSDRQIEINPFNLCLKLQFDTIAAVQNWSKFFTSMLMCYLFLCRWFSDKVIKHVQSGYHKTFQDKLLGPWKQLKMDVKFYSALYRSLIGCLLVRRWFTDSYKTCTKVMILFLKPKTASFAAENRSWPHCRET